MHHPHTPPVQLAAELADKAQKEINAYYKGVEWEVVTEKTKFGMGHICKMYVDGNFVESGLAGL